MTKDWQVLNCKLSAKKLPLDMENGFIWKSKLKRKLTKRSRLNGISTKEKFYEASLLHLCKVYFKWKQCRNTSIAKSLKSKHQASVTNIFWKITAMTDIINIIKLLTLKFATTQ